MSDTVLLVFLQPHDVYNAGETAGFTESGARRILDLRKTAVDGAGNKESVPSPVARLATAEEIERASAPPEPKPEPAVRRIRFDHPVGPYIAGEIAAFAPSVAERYVKGYRHGAGFRPAVAHYYEDADVEAGEREAGEPQSAGAGEPEGKPKSKPAARHRRG